MVKPVLVDLSLCSSTNDNFNFSLVAVTAGSSSHVMAKMTPSPDTGISKSTANYSNTQIRSTITGMILDVPIKEGNSVIQSNNFNDGTTIATVANMNDMIFIGNIDETEVGRIHVNMPMKLTIGAIENQRFDAVLEYISPKGNEQNGAILFEIKAAARISQDVLVRAG